MYSKRKRYPYSKISDVMYAFGLTWNFYQKMNTMINWMRIECVCVFFPISFVSFACLVDLQRQKLNKTDKIEQE